MRRSFVAALAALALVSPATAQGMPGDLPFAPTSPAPDAALPTGPDGIPVTFTCPVYRIADPGFPLYGGARDYGVSFSTGTATGPDGRLTDPVALGTGAYVAGSEDQCASALGAGGSVRPQETPGVYYWQVWRLCTGCPTSYEVGPVLKLTLGSPAKPTLRLPKKLYAGYPVIATVGGDGLPTGTTVTVERKAGSRWTRAGVGTLASNVAEPTVTLPKGKQTVRVSATLGGQTLTSAEVTRTVRAATAKAGRVTAGRYRGTVGPGCENWTSDSPSAGRPAVMSSAS